MNYLQHKISTWAVEDRPVEKLMLKGIQTLSNAEVLSLIIGSSTIDRSSLEIAKILLGDFDNDLDKLAKASVSKIASYKGIGVSKALRIVSVFELARRRKMNSRILSKISSSRDIHSEFEFLKDLEHEEFWVLFLRRNNTIIYKTKISQGGTAGTVIDTKIIMKNAVEKLAAAIICVHNNPSGSIIPSEADKSITQKIKHACAVMDISLLDHIIIGSDEYYSFADEIGL